MIAYLLHVDKLLGLVGQVQLSNEGVKERRGVLAIACLGSHLCDLSDWENKGGGGRVMVVQ